jgi:AP-1 complex subunit sigma 1/2
VTAALNFETADCHVIGGCDLYTTKAAGSDKKLYRNIEHTLESQHESLLRLSASLSPPQAESLADELNLSRSSPFGPLSQISSRRTFAYLIATLNASHPDYDFSNLLRPSDFCRERSYRNVMNTIDTTIYNLRPRPMPTLPTGLPDGKVQGTTGSQTWGSRMWRVIDTEMDLKHCAVYNYAPDEDPFDGEEGAIWSHNYFFFNKERKRVCYVYLRGESVLSHSPVMGPVTPKRTVSARGSVDYSASGARKRARYWLGDHLDGYDVKRVGSWDDSDDFVIRDPGDDEVDADDEGPYYIGDVSSEDDEDIQPSKEREKSAVRGVSEQLMESMEV